MGSKILCEKCGKTIAPEWDNEHHYGTCPFCKQGANFIVANEEHKELAEHENGLKKKKWLINRYDVFYTTDSGTIRVNCINLGKLIYEECDFNFRTVEDKDTGKLEIYYYENGLFHPGGENRIRERVDFFLDDYSSIHRKNEVVDYIKHCNIVDRERLEPQVTLINLKNGIYNLETDKLENHTPEFFFLNQIPVEYHEDSKCPRIEKFLSEVLYKKYVPVVQEIFGYLLYRRYKFHKAFLLYGGGRNGKSTLIKLMEKFVGFKNVSNRTLTDILEDRFATASLYGKLMNSGGEVGGKALNDTTKFKHLTGDDTIEAQKKFHGSFSFKNYAKLLFNANHIPYSKFDKSLAYFNRWVILVFPETFELGDARTDPDIDDKLGTKEELEGLLLYAIEGLKRLLKNNRFTYDDADDEETVGERYELLAKPEMRFIKDYIRVCDGSILPTEEVYDKYFDWADKRFYPKQVKKVFTKSMKKYMSVGDEIKCDVKTTSRDGKTVKMYTNVAWKDKPTESIKTTTLDSISEKISGDVPTDIHDALVKIKENMESGYKIDDDFLEYNFESGFVAKLLESGMLIRLADGTYDLA